MSISIRFEFHLHITRNDNRPQKSETPASPAPSSRPGFIASAEQLLPRLAQSMSRSTLDNFRTALRQLRLYLEHDVPASQLTADRLKGFERWLRSRNLCPNTISCYMRSLRSLMAKQPQADRPKENPFAQVFTGRTKTDKRAVTEECIASLRRLKLKPGSYMSLVRDVFLFSFYALGMPFVDIAFLRRSQIVNGQLTYYRHKTGRRVSIRLEPCMTDIISRYEAVERDYVFPLLKSPDPAEAYGEYLRMLNRYNRSLKSLARKAGISPRLTSYVARHTWASVAFQSNVDLPVISKALGHANPQNTLVYIREINDQRLDEANRQIVNRV